MIAKRLLAWFVLLAAIAAPRLGRAALSETPSAFGNVNVKQTATLGGTISQSTTGQSNVIDLDLTAAGCSVFDITPKVSITVSDTAPATITSSFAPVARGNASCVVTMRDRTTLASLGTFTLTGTGIAPVIGVNPLSKAYGGTRWNDAAPIHSIVQVFTVSNTGDVPLTVAFAFVGGQTGDYVVTSGTLPATIAPGGSQSFSVTFNPLATGASSTTLQITSNDPLTPQINVPLSGIGTNAVIGTTDINFGVVNLGANNPQSISVSNTGAATRGPLTVTSATIANGNGWYTFNGGGCSGTTCTFAPALSITAAAQLVPVKCQPPSNATGSQAAQVTFTSDSDINTNDTSNLTCTAGRADVMIDTPMITFPNQLLNTTSTPTTVTISNIGTNIALTYSITKLGTNPNQFVIGGGCVTNCSLVAGANTTFTVAFAPTSLLAKSALVQITSNDPDNPTVDIAVSGTGVAPHAAVSPTPIAFANTEVGKTSAKTTLTLTNTGAADLAIASAGLTLGSPDFIVAGTFTAQTIAPNATATWDLACKPLSPGLRAGTFQITSNTDATNGATANIVTSVALSCTGEQGILTVLAPTTFNFGPVRIGDVAPPHTFALKNTGNVTVSNITGVLASTTVGYAISTTFPISLAAGATANIVVQFAPQTTSDGGPVTITFTGVWGTTMTTTMMTASVDGSGQSVGFATNPAAPTPLDFGDLRFDTTKSLTFAVTDTDMTAVSILSMTVSPVTAMTGELTILSYTHGVQTVTCTSTCPAVTLTGLNDKITVTVRVAPANRVAMLSANVIVHSDLGMNPDRTVPLLANSTTAVLALTPPTNVVDFGAVDRDLPGPSQTIRLTNTGVAPLTVGAATKGGPDLARYVFSAAPATAIAPNGFVDVTVTYTPTAERPANQFDVATITFPISGAIATPASVTVMVQGRGIDRHINVGAVPMFPTTFRNPGDKAPVMPISVRNTGEAPLNISAVMVSQGPIWQLQNPAPVTVPGFGSYDFNVSFAPTTSGKAPDGQLTIINNDNLATMVVVTLQGYGANRNVDMGPDPIDLGYTGIGVPIKLSQVAQGQLLHVASMDATNTFKMRSISVDGGDGAFTAIDPPVGVALMPNATRDIDVEFAPMAEGDYTATVTLYLDMDPTAQATVTLKGHALFVDAQGGGCSTGRDTSGAMILVLGALLLARRRQLVVIAIAIAPLTSHAEQRNLDLSVFRPTPATTGSSFELQTPDVGSDGAWVATALVSYANDPLILKTSLNDDGAVRAQTLLEIGGAYAFLDRFEAGAHMPFYNQSGDPFVSNKTMYGIAPASGTARGDLSVHGKMRFTERGALMLGAGASLTLPTATSDQFTGAKTPTGRALLLASIAPHKRLTISANLGAVVRSKVQFANIEQASGLAWGTGASLRVFDHMSIGAEIYGELVPSGRLLDPTPAHPMGSATVLNTAEALWGLHFQLERRMSVAIAAGHGIGHGLGAATWRGLFALTFTPSAPEIIPLHPYVPHVAHDSDGDGISDDDDKCPNEPEDRDMFDDADGCPDPDNDNDGVPDARDKCPLDAEDRDGFQDEDGCPEKDNDADGIPDAQDKCPNDPEDRDGFQDLDGCPDPDNDGDGIPDARDKCPNEAETINGIRDEDGCPDSGDSLVVISPDRLELLQAIQFSGTKLARTSTNVLGQVGATLRAHMEIVRIRITVHVQPSKDSDRDQQISDKRAAAVREWLVNYGIAASRVEVRGFGGSKPLVAANQKGSAMINDRIDLIILERK